MAVKLGDLLLKQKLITQQQLETALKLQREEGGKIGEALVRVGAVSEADITETLSQQFGGTGSAGLWSMLAGSSERRAVAALSAPTRLFRRGEPLALMPFTFVR